MIAFDAFGFALEAGIDSERLDELYRAADEAVEAVESEYGPDEEGAAGLREALRALEAKMPRDESVPRLADVEHELIGSTWRTPL